MAQYGWPDCPTAVRGQVEEFVRAVGEILGEELVGAYLHGSLAMGCFNSERSDLDLFFVTRHGMAVGTKRRLAELLLRASGCPRPIEVSFLRRQDLHPWQYPTPFDFHYGEDWRARFEAQLASGAWREWNGEAHRDPDLAAHCTMARHRGLCLYGRPVEEAFPVVPRADYLASILGDFEWARDRMAADPVYFVLNSCRVLWYMREDAVCSKEEAGVWALGHLAEPSGTVVRLALEIYRGTGAKSEFEAGALREFAAHVESEVRTIRRREAP